MRILIALVSFILVSCNRKSLDEQQYKHNDAYILHKLNLQYYPSFSDLLGVEVDFEKEKLKLYNPTTDYNYVELDSIDVQVSPVDLIKINNIVI